MTSPTSTTVSTTTRVVAALRLAGISVVLAAGIAGFASAGTGADSGSVQLDLAVVSTANGH
jgi:hypothetical protein